MTFVNRVGEENTVEQNWGQLNWLVGAKQMPGSEMTFGICTIEPGQRNPLHLHPNCEELLYVISGTCEHKLGDEVYHLEPGSVIRIPRGVPHHAKCTSDAPLVAVISFSSPDRLAVTLEADGEG